MPLTHIRQGDVVFTVDATGTLMHRVISTAQVLGDSSGHRSSVHAAIATGTGFEVYESVGSGLKKQQLKAGNYRIYAYRGPQQDDIRSLAVMIAESFYAQSLGGGFGAYNSRKAALSVTRSSSRGHQTINGHTAQFGDEAKSHRRFFCSNLIFRCFAGASEAAGLVQLAIPDSHSQISPRDLEGLLIQSNFWHSRNHGAVMQHP